MRRTTQPSTRRSLKCRCPVRSLALPAGDLVAAFGVFYKEDKYEYVASPAASVVPARERQGRTYRGSVPRMTSRATTTTSTCTSKLLVPAAPRLPGRRSRSRPCSATGSPTTRRPAASIPGKRSSSTSRSRACGCAAPTRTPFGRRACSSSTCRSCCVRRFDSSFRRCRIRVTVGSPAATGPDAARVEALCLAQGMPASVLPTFRGLATTCNRGPRRESGPRAGGGIDDHARRWSGPRRCRIRCSPTCSCRSTGTRSRSTTR